jgi:flavin-dependent dehydrogenase
MATLYDIAILGSTAAGYAAAWALAKKKLKTVVVASPRQPAECPLTDWVPGDFFAQGLPKSLAKACGASEFRQVCYHNAALDKHEQYSSRKRAGWLVNAARLEKALKAEADAVKVDTRTSNTRPAIQLQEDSVVLMGSRRIEAKMLIIAQGLPNDIMGDLALPVRTVAQGHLIVAGLDVPLNKQTAASIDECLNIVEMHERSELGMFFRQGNTLHLRVISNSAAAGNRAAELSSLVCTLQAAGLLPASLSLAGAKGAVWHPPAGVALELESHVAKRCILAGTGGGFAESITGQTLQPTVQSALLAAQVAADAIKADDPQDALMNFKELWRQEMADYLRPPSTSLRLLLPLLFVNQNIVDKFTQALLFGETI